MMELFHQIRPSNYSYYRIVIVMSTRAEHHALLYAEPSASCDGLAIARDKVCPRTYCQPINVIPSQAAAQGTPSIQHWISV